PLAGVPRILVRPDIPPGPAIESALAHARDVIGRQIVAEPVALVGRAPQIAGGGIDREADAIADAGRENAPALALRIEHQHVGALALAAPGGAEGLVLLPF